MARPQTLHGRRPCPNRRIISPQDSYYSVSEAPSSADSLSILILAETRRYLRRAHARMMVAFFALLYALGSMFLGGMVILARTPWGYSAEVLWGNALGQGTWNYPGLLILAPWGVVTLPFLATIAMILVSVGVGIGVSVALLIAAQLVRDRKQSSARPGAIGSVAGLTPAMIALVTLGACCSTTAAATAGVGLVAQASGSSLNNLLVNNWYLDLFQVVVVFVALLAQEMLLRVYGGLFGLGPRADGSGVPVDAPVPWGARLVAGGLLRAALLIAGITWSLAMFADWTTVSPWSASATLWFQWIFQHQVVSILAILVALFPGAVARSLSRTGLRPVRYGLRLGLLVGGLSLATWVPPVVAAGGAAGFVNELFSVAGLPATWGAVAPVYAPGLALYVRWGLQYLLLGGFAVAVSLSPGRAIAPALWTRGSSLEDASPRVERSATADSAGTEIQFRPSTGIRPDPSVSARGFQDP
jgi:hypothetical protein